MIASTTIGRYQEMLGTLGRQGLHMLFSDDFEVYIITFEVTDSEGRTEEFLTLPVMPNTINISEPEIVNIKKTATGIVSLKTDSFVPKQITLAGNFGRNFKFLMRGKLYDFRSVGGKIKEMKNDFEGVNIKTGYGTVKALRSLLENSRELDMKKRPKRLYFYNFAFGENYITEVIDKNFSQDKSASNMIWNYNIILKAVAPINSNIRDSKSLMFLTSSDFIQKGVTSLSGDLMRSLPKILR